VPHEHSGARAVARHGRFVPNAHSSGLALSCGKLTARRFAGVVLVVSDKVGFTGFGVLFPGAWDLNEQGNCPSWLICVVVSRAVYTSVYGQKMI